MNKGMRGGERDRGGGGKKKIGKESRLSPVINGGIPARRKGRRGRRVAQGKDLDSLRKNSVFGMKRKQTIIYID